MKKEALQKLCRQTATALREAGETIGQQEDTIAEQKEKLAAYRKEERVRTLAKTAVSRGIINDDTDSVEDFVANAMTSPRPLDVIEQGLDFATSDSFSSVKEASDEEAAGLGKGNLDPIASMVLGHIGLDQ